MEIPPSSSIAQATAYFTGYSEEEQKRQILSLFPHSGPNVLLESTDREQAISFTGEATDFLMADRIEGHRILQGHLMYPFHEQAEIFNHKFDPLYFDGSEDYQNFNVQENLIGRPLGANVLQDHRLAFVDNLLKLKEYQSANSALDDDYLKQLYLTNTEKGAQYYFNQLQDLRDSMGIHARQNAARNALPLHDIHFTSKIQRGVGSHERPPEARTFPKLSSSLNVQSNHRQDQMRVAERRFIPERVTEVVDQRWEKIDPPADVSTIPHPSNQEGIVNNPPGGPGGGPGGDDMLESKKAVTVDSTNKKKRRLEYYTSPIETPRNNQNRPGGRVRDALTTAVGVGFASALANRVYGGNPNAGLKPKNTVFDPVAASQAMVMYAGKTMYEVWEEQRGGEERNPALDDMFQEVKEHASYAKAKTQSRINSHEIKFTGALAKAGYIPPPPKLPPSILYEGLFEPDYVKAQRAMEALDKKNENVPTPLPTKKSSSLKPTKNSR